ncbi:MAG: Smr/MutS family protein [Bdellovibrionota bacterium]
MKSLDLHGYTKDDAIDAIDRFLYEFGSSKEKRAKIVTGKGTGAIQKVTTDYLRKAGYHFSYEKLSNGKDNTGVLIVFG